MLQWRIDGWSSCNFKGAFYRTPWTLSKQMFLGGRQVFQVDQALSGPTVIRPLPARLRQLELIESRSQWRQLLRQAGLGRLLEHIASAHPSQDHSPVPRPAINRLTADCWRPTGRPRRTIKLDLPSHTDTTLVSVQRGIRNGWVIWWWCELCYQCWSVIKANMYRFMRGHGSGVGRRDLANTRT